jgi:hypothetical protein
VGPFFLAYVLAALYPKVLDILGLISLVINNFNGYIIPALLRIGIYKKEVNKQKTKILMIYIYLAIMIGLAGFGLYIKLFK